MKGIICVLFFITSGLFIKARAQQGAFNKPGYYKIMEEGNSEAIDKQLKIIDAAPDLNKMNKDAYTGALLMKKASLLKGAPNKLSVFKDGHRKLEGVIKNDNDNVEWRFLRLIIQEHAPKVVNYRSEIKTDAEFIQHAFKKLPPELQAVVVDYRKHSDTLQTLNF